MSQEENIFSHIHPQRISLQIENQIKQAIFDNHYRAGEKIPSERVLAELFNSSRSSVREALRTLERSGLIVVRKGVQGGAYETNNICKHVVESRSG